MDSSVTKFNEIDNPSLKQTSHPAQPVDRRSALRVGLELGAGALFAGCSSSNTRSSTVRTGSSRTAGDGMTPIAGGSGRTVPRPAGSYASAPEFKSHKPAWLDGWRSGQGREIAGVEPRTSWARFGPNPRKADRMGRVTRLTVHHDGMNAFTTADRAAAARRLENIRSAHVGQGWADIGYHYVIDPGGRVWQGRPTSLQGAHVRQNNPGNIGIMVMGNYNKQRVSNAGQRALLATVASLMQQHNISRSRVYTHRELVSTACPGVRLQRTMNTLRAGRLA